MAGQEGSDPPGYEEGEYSADKRKHPEVFFGGIRGETSDEVVREAFSTAGTVISVRLKRRRNTGDFKGFGFVRFSDETAAQQACQRVKEVSGQPVGVHRLHSKSVEQLLNEAQPHALSPPADTAASLSRLLQLLKGHSDKQAAVDSALKAITNSAQKRGTAAKPAAVSALAAVAAFTSAPAAAAPAAAVAALQPAVPAADAFADRQAATAQAQQINQMQLPQEPVAATADSGETAAPFGHRQRTEQATVSTVQPKSEPAQSTTPAAPGILTEPLPAFKPSAPIPDPQTFLDSFPKCKQLVSKFREKSNTFNKTPSAILHEYATRLDLDLVYGEYAEKELGPFDAEAKLMSTDGSVLYALGKGRGRNKKDAKQVAAASALEMLLVNVDERDFLLHTKPSRGAVKQGGPGPASTSGRSADPARGEPSSRSGPSRGPSYGRPCRGPPASGGNRSFSGGRGGGPVRGRYGGSGPDRFDRDRRPWQAPREPRDFGGQQAGYGGAGRGFLPTAEPSFRAGYQEPPPAFSEAAPYGAPGQPQSVMPGLLRGGYGEAHMEGPMGLGMGRPPSGMKRGFSAMQEGAGLQMEQPRYSAGPSLPAPSVEAIMDGYIPQQEMAQSQGMPQYGREAPSAYYNPGPPNAMPPPHYQQPMSASQNNGGYYQPY